MTREQKKMVMDSLIARGASDDEIKAHMRRLSVPSTDKQAPAPARPSASDYSKPTELPALPVAPGADRRHTSVLESANRGFADKAMFGVMPAISAGLRTLPFVGDKDAFGKPLSYRDNLAAVNAEGAAIQADNPNAYNFGAGAGYLAAPPIPIGAAGRTAPLIHKIASGAAHGTATALAQSTGEAVSRGESPAQIADSVGGGWPVGAVVGGALPLAPAAYRGAKNYMAGATGRNIDAAAEKMIEGSGSKNRRALGKKADTLDELLADPKRPEFRAAAGNDIALAREAEKLLAEGGATKAEIAARADAPGWKPTRYTAAPEAPKAAPHAPEDTGGIPEPVQSEATAAKTVAMPNRSNAETANYTGPNNGPIPEPRLGPDAVEHLEPTVKVEAPPPPSVEALPEPEPSRIVVPEQYGEPHDPAIPWGWRFHKEAEAELAPPPEPVEPPWAKRFDVARPPEPRRLPSRPQPPAAAPPPEPEKIGGISVDSVIDRINKRLEGLRGGNSVESDVADKLTKIRDGLVLRKGGQGKVSVGELRSEQSGYQSGGKYNRDAKDTVGSLANEAAAEETGDALTSHLSGGLDYAAAREYAKSNPGSDVAKWLHSNDIQSTAMRLQDAIDYRKGTPPIAAETKAAAAKAAAKMKIHMGAAVLGGGAAMLHRSPYTIAATIAADQLLSHAPLIKRVADRLFERIGVMPASDAIATSAEKLLANGVHESVVKSAVTRMNKDVASAEPEVSE